MICMDPRELEHHLQEARLQAWKEARALVDSPASVDGWPPVSLDKLNTEAALNVLRLRMDARIHKLTQ